MQRDISGLFQFAAQFTRQEHWLLSDREAKMEAERACDLADSLNWNLSAKNSPIACAVMLALSTYSIVKPRLDITVAMANAINVSPSAPATPGEARSNGSRPAGGIDFSADIEAQVNQGNGEYNVN